MSGFNEMPLSREWRFGYHTDSGAVPVVERLSGFFVGFVEQPHDFFNAPHMIHTQLPSRE